MPEPFIITACFDDAMQRHLDGLREQYFPPGRTVIGAHLTLFHAIPAFARGTVLAAVGAACARQPPFQVALSDLYSLGGGFAIRVQSPELMAMRKGIAAPLRAMLTPQDGQPFHPHVTLANKLPPAEAKSLLTALQATWHAGEAGIQALAVWRYLGPQWELERRVAFTG